MARARKQAGRPAAEDDAAIRLGFYLHDASRLRKLVYDAAFRPAGVTRAQAWVLSYLWTQDGLTQSELAQRLDLGKVALGSLVDKLEAAGMVKRRADASDRRAKRVLLTARGRATLTRLRELGTEANESVLAGISARDVAVTTRTLKRMKTNLVALLGGAASADDEA
ncbi:MAG: MarR family transcriptional regulator [Gammaproteobacteria bacterium]